MFLMGFYINFNDIILPLKEQFCGGQKTQKLIKSPLSTSLSSKSLGTQFAVFFMKFNTWLCIGLKNISYNSAHGHNPFPALGILQTC